MDWLWCSTVDILIKFESKLHDVDAEILPVTIIFIGEVLKTCSDDVFVNRKQSILNGRFWNRMDGDRGSFVWLTGNRVDALLIVEDEEILQRLLSIQLPLSLDWFTLYSVEDLHVVLGSDSETLVIRFCFVKYFDNTHSVISEDDSVLHEFNGVVVMKVCGSTLRSIVHDGYLQVRVLREISHGDCEWDREVVTSDIVGSYRFLVLHFDVKTLFLEVPFLHFKTIWISPKCLVGLETVEHFPCHDDIFALAVIIDGNWG